MLNKILTALYLRLRQFSKLSRSQFASQLKIGRDTLRNYEAGNTRPDPETERKLVEVSRCSNIELAEMLCELLSKELGVRVGIMDGEIGYRAVSSLARAEQVRRIYGTDISATLRRALANQLHTAQLLALGLDRLHADLDEVVDDCIAGAEARRAARAATAVEHSTQGATGPARGAEPVFSPRRPSADAPQGGGGRARQSLKGELY